MDFLYYASTKFACTKFIIAITPRASQINATKAYSQWQIMAAYIYVCTSHVLSIVKHKLLYILHLYSINVFHYNKARHMYVRMKHCKYTVGE